MAGRTQGHEILLVVRTAFACSLDVVDKCGRGQYSLSLAQFAQGMFLEKLFPSLSPRSTIVFLGIGIPFIAFIDLSCQLGMFLTIPVVREERAPWIGAW